jgi:hypothetical protein
MLTCNLHDVNYKMPLLRDKMLLLQKIPYFVSCLNDESLRSTEKAMKKRVNAADEGWQNGLIGLRKAVQRWE